MHMNEKKLDVSVLMPALNEEENIVSAINAVLESFKNFSINGEIIVINDGSNDKTGELINDVIEKDNRVRMIRHDDSRGIGACFWEGVDIANGDIVVMLPGDNENDPQEIFRYYKLLEHVDIVIPFLFNMESRSLFRNALSVIYRFIINSTFLVNFNYTNGTVLYRKSILQDLSYRNKSFFFQTDILIRAVKKEYLFAEVPYKLGSRRHGTSKAVNFPSFVKVVGGYIRLVRDLYFTKNVKNGPRFSKDSLTGLRRNDRG